MKGAACPPTYSTTQRSATPSDELDGVALPLRLAPPCKMKGKQAQVLLHLGHLKVLAEEDEALEEELAFASSGSSWAATLPQHSGDTALHEEAILHPHPPCPSPFSPHSMSTGPELTPEPIEMELGHEHTVRQFIRDLQVGRELLLVLSTGHTHPCQCTLSAHLDILRLRPSANREEIWEIQLAEVRETVPGNLASDNTVCSRLETPQDCLSVTLVLTTGRCVTFRLENANMRDIFVMLLASLSNSVVRASWN